MIKLLKIFLAIILLLCLLRWPYGYYSFVRLMGLIGFGILALYYFSLEKAVLGVVFVGLAILFQPLVKVVMSRSAWNAVDVVVAIFLIVLTIVEKGKPKTSASDNQQLT